MTSFIYTNAGNVRPRFQHVDNHLPGNAFVFVDTLKIFKKYKVTGNGVQPFKMALDLFAPALGAYSGKIPCILRPCWSESTVIDNGYSANEIEQRLMTTYRKNGFATWYQRRDRDDEISVMGRMIQPVVEISDDEEEEEEEEQIAKASQGKATAQGKTTGQEKMATQEDSTQEETLEESLEEDYTEEEYTTGHRVSSSKKRKRSTTKVTTSTKRTKKGR